MIDKTADKLRKIKDILLQKGFRMNTPVDFYKLLKFAVAYFGKHGMKTFAITNSKIETFASSKNNGWGYQMTYLEKITAVHSEFHKMRKVLGTLPNQPAFTVIVMKGNQNDRTDTLNSIESLVYDAAKIQVIVLEECENGGQPVLSGENLTNAVEKATGDYLLFLREGDIIHRNALFEFAVTCNMESADVVYCDHDNLSNGQRIKPTYKMGWSPALFAGENYISRACIVKRCAVRPDNGWQQILKSAVVNNKVCHMEGIYFSLICHQEEEWVIANNSSLPKGSPKISFIISTEWEEGKVFSCIDRIQKNVLTPYEIIVISKGKGIFNFANEKKLKDKNCILIKKDENSYNTAAEQAVGDMLMFLGDEAVVEREGDILSLIEEAQKENTGAVGPLLLAEDGKVLSAGMFYDYKNDVMRHFFQGEKPDCGRFYGMLAKVRNVTAVSFEAFAITKESYRLYGGLKDCGNLQEAFLNLCMKLKEQGRSCVVCPQSKIKTNGAGWSTPVLNQLIKKDLYLNSYITCTGSVPKIDLEPTLISLAGTPTISREEIKKILLVKLDHIGDVILSLPAIRKVRREFPHSKITVLCAPWMKEIFENQPELDEIKTYNYFFERSMDGTKFDDQEKHEELSRLLKCENYDLVIHLRRHEQTKRLSADCGDFCLAYSTNPETDDITHPVPALKDITGVQSKWHISDQFRTLISPLEDDTDLYKPLSINQKTKEKVEQYFSLKNFPKDKILIGFHVKAGNEAKQWREEYFARLADWLIEKKNAVIILSGTAAEKETNEKVMKMMKGKEVTSIAGELSLLEYSCFVQKFDYYIGLDTGPTHICGLQGVPILEIFSGFTSYKEWAPIGDQVMVLYKSTNCAPCGRALSAMCDRNGKCMNEILPIDAYRAFEKLSVMFPARKMK